MMVLKKYFFPFVLVFISLIIRAQNTQFIDSLQKTYLNSSSDTAKVTILETIAWFTKEEDPKKADSLARYALEYSRQLYVDKKISELQYEEHLVKSYVTFGGIANIRGDRETAIKNYMEALKYFEKNKKHFKAATMYNNIASIYFFQENYRESIKFFARSMKIKEEIRKENPDDRNNLASLAKTYNNLGSNYVLFNEYDSAVAFFNKSVEIKKSLKDFAGVAKTYNNIGELYMKIKQPKKAEPYLMEAYELAKQEDLKYDMIGILISQAMLYMASNYNSEAESFIKEAITIAEENGYYQDVWVAYDTYAKVLEHAGKHKEAIPWIRKFIKLKDSLNQQQILESNADLVTKYETDKKDKEISILNEKNKNAALEAEKEQMRRYALIGGLILVLVFAGFIFNRFRVTQRQKHIIELQKELMAEKQKEILDSIRYAQRIQKSLLPTEKYIEKRLKPKDKNNA